MPRTLRVLSVVASLWAAAPLLTGATAPTAAGTAEIQLQLGALLFSEARYEEALVAYRQALQTDEPALRVRAGKGTVRSAIRVAEFSLAAEEASRLMGLAPGDPEVLALSGDALWANGMFGEAESAFHDAIALSPAEARARTGMARALASRNKLDEAVGEALVAVAQAPGDAEAHHTLGYIYEQMRRFDAAATEYTNVLRLLPVRDRSPQAYLLRAQAAYLRTFGKKIPYELEQPAGVTLHTVPFREVGGKVVVQARVNGSEWMDFVVDTGSERTVISERTARRVGVTPMIVTLSAGVGEIGLRGLQVGTLDSLEIGSLRIKNLPCLIKNPPLIDMPTREGESLSPPALGLSMRIDYQKRQLTIGSHLPAAAADFELPLHLHRLATVQGIVDKGRRANFVVDTGGELISISSATARALNIPTDTRRIPLKVYGTSGWDRDAYLLPGVDLAFDAIQFRNFPVVVLNLEAPSVLLGYQLGGIIGHKFLSRYRVDIDLERSLLRLKQIAG
jgi:Flp pilus assembly protein TadD/predicted aspartyl protease